MGTQGEDVLLSEEGFTRIPFHIECKNRAKIAIYEYYDQPKTKDNVLLIIKQNYREPLAVIDASLFFELLKEIYDTKEIKVSTERGCGNSVDDSEGTV